MHPNADVLQGTLDLLILKAVSLQQMHGWGISQRIQQMSSGVLEVNQGSLYPALHRLVKRRWLEASWGTGLALPGAAQTRARGEAQCPMGHVREQSQGSLLSPHRCRQKAARRRNRHLETVQRRRRRRARDDLNDAAHSDVTRDA